MNAQPRLFPHRVGLASLVITMMLARDGRHRGQQHRTQAGHRGFLDGRQFVVATLLQLVGKLDNENAVFGHQADELHQSDLGVDIHGRGPAVGPVGKFSEGTPLVCHSVRRNSNSILPANRADAPNLGCSIPMLLSACPYFLFISADRLIGVLFSSIFRRTAQRVQDACALKFFVPRHARFRESFRSSPQPGEFRRAGLQGWILRHQLDGVVQVSGFENENSTNLLFRLGVGAIRDGYLAALPTQGDDCHARSPIRAGMLSLPVPEVSRWVH